MNPSPVAAPKVEAAVRNAGRATLAREWLSFALGHEEYGIDILGVQEIRGYEQPTRIADAPASVCGVLNLRGVIVPIVDLRTRFGLEPRFDSKTVTVVLCVSGHVVGVVADSVSDVVQLGPEQVKPAPEFSRTAMDTGHIIGLGTVRQGERARMLVLLDMERLISGPTLGLASKAHNELH